MKDRFIDWVALGSVDVDDFIVDNFKDPDDWERNFRASKARGQVRIKAQKVDFFR